MRIHRTLALQCLAGLAMFSTTEAADFYGIHSSNPNNFLAFYPELRHQLLNISLGTCSQPLQEYYDSPKGIEKFIYCNNMVSCVMNVLNESDKAKIGASAVLLGLTPVILATMGPSLAEISLLSSRRPFLSLLLGLGSPSVFFERIASYSDPLELLRPRPGNLVVQNYQSHAVSSVIMLLEYVMAACAVINIVTNSVQLGEWTVLSWRCADARMVVLWALLPVGIHLVAAISFNLSKAARASGLRGSSGHNAGEWIGTRIVLSEFTLSANRPKRKMNEENNHEGVLVVTLQWIATVFSFVHILFGTMVLSGLLFLVPKDALSVVGRFMASSLVSRAIVIFEVAGLRNDYVPQTADNFFDNNRINQDNHVITNDSIGEDIALVHGKGATLMRI